ncbi:ImmA/IrrE family metallo-endopeptidase [Paenibacillus naphthalenovorans]|uniref:ImmA/IrrE family metallo-endopeptidase n=1 Tax=Paenibacillus naphthalenovorans TaxID=162209 RepID=UPI0008801608|nr:ImmA/IrrE family metallo-endopeptidase [Paenibacillus naphthalenovorans]SDJ59187.1 protein of unknown function [Paenibacillus naphthalenovorans]
MIKPNYFAAEKAARNFLYNFNISSLPVPLEIYFKAFPDLRIASYSWYANKHDIDIDEVITHTDSDSGCCWYIPEMKKYMILYNDTISNPGHIRWTIAHELGHYALKHNEKTNRSIIARSSLTKSEYDAFEKEANCFARTLLAPPYVLHGLKKFDARDISEWCNISMAAAINILKFFNKGLELGRNFNPLDDIAQLFSRYIYEKNNERQCTNCNHYFISPTGKFCPVCCNKRLLKRRGVNWMIYDGYILNEDHLPITCPQCENEQITGNFCKICGVGLLNKCTNVEYDNYGESIIWECGAIAEGNARYCIQCGHPTTYLKQGLLKPWNEVKQEIRLSIDLPF